ncbi:MAG: assimilatory sulfite reductase (NADPH) flavoprotein subunit [Gammaproteobacteria bacterium]
MALEAVVQINPALIALSSEQSSALQHAVSGLTAEQLIWSSGYLAGLATAQPSAPERNSAAIATPDRAAVPGEHLTILYGSQTGNGQHIAEQLHKDAQSAGLATKLVNMADFKARDIAKESWVAIVISTHGEGDAPDDAELLLEYLVSKRAPKLPKLNYFVLALGDSSYAQYCQSGHDIDHALSALGATRVGELTECDVDYEESAQRWSGNTLATATEKLKHTKQLGEQLGKELASGYESPAIIPLQVVENAPVYGKENPFPAEVLLNQEITGTSSSKKVHHLELDLTASGLQYEPGDALAVVTENPESLVEDVLQATGLDGEVHVSVEGAELTLADALTSRLEISANSGAFIQRYIDLTNNAELAGQFADANQKNRLLSDYQVGDVLYEWPLEAVPGSQNAQEFVNTLRPLTPRVYSISSSSLSTPDEVHITVAEVNYTAFERPHVGSASTALAVSHKEGEKLGVYVDPNPRFRLPADDSTDVIMIGPGTGVAPFRSFVEHRSAREASGKNWLFFGDRNFSDDFLYQLEWQKHIKDGTLHRLDVAFSRDQKDKIYVQNLLKQRGAEVFEWLESGAHLYICGDAKHMAPDVHEALLNVIEQASESDRKFAEDYLKNLKQTRRYLRDVY